jgi:hypothetical protein
MPSLPPLLKIFECFFPLQTYEVGGEARGTQGAQKEASFGCTAPEFTPGTLCVKCAKEAL